MRTELALGRFAPFHPGLQLDIGIGLYWVKDVRFISIQYIALLVMEVYGFVHWVHEEQAADEFADPHPAPATGGGPA